MALWQIAGASWLRERPRASLDLKYDPQLLPFSAPMIHLLGEAHTRALAKGLENFRLARILRSAERVQRFNIKNSHLNLVAEPVDAPYNIQELILTGPEHNSVVAMGQIAPRLNKNSTILVLHSLPGVADKLKGLWSSRKRPLIVQGLPPVDDSLLISDLGKELSLAQKIVSSKGSWIADWYPEREIKLIQMENLIVRCCLEPLGVILDCDFRSLVSDSYEHMIDMILTESCRIVERYHQEPMVNFQRMKELVRAAALVSKRNQRSELATSVAQGHSKPLYLLNLHIVEMAKSMGFSAPINTNIASLVAARAVWQTKKPL